ncbi:MAG: PQQ-binding-like beta-propeller repeat protein, partial [Pirellulales bacterium]
MRLFLPSRGPGCRLASLACLFGAVGLAPAAAGEWPQILGPDRNGIARDERIADEWPADGPPVQWQREVGSGLAGVAVAGGKALLFHRIGDEELAEAMDPSTGQVLWTARFPTRYVPTYTADDGPRCVPLIHGGRVYLYGARRGLHCIRLEDGKVLWSRDLFKDYVSAAEEGFFGAGSSPLVEGDKLLVNLGGGRASAGIVALDLDTGKTIWKATDEEASYSSPVAATIGGRRQAIFVTRYHVVSLDPKTGDAIWRIRFGARGPTVNAANPLVLDGHVFVSASYGVGALYADVRHAEPKTVWKSDKVKS